MSGETNQDSVHSAQDSVSIAKAKERMDESPQEQLKNQEKAQLQIPRSKTTINDLPQEFLSPIFHKLNNKDMICAWLCCKLGGTTISDPKFLKNHLRIRGQSPLTLVRSRMLVENRIKDAFCLHRDVRDFILSEDVEFPMKNMKFRYKIVGCCLGVVCLSATYPQAGDDMDLVECIILWNPSVRKVQIIPESQLEMYESSIRAFGADTNDNFKILHWVSGPSQLEIFQLGRNQWDSLNETVSPSCKVCKPCLCGYANNSVYWLGHESADGVRKRNTIVGFDFSNHRFQHLPLPKSLIEVDVRGLSILDHEDRLSIVNCNNSHVTVWALENDGLGKVWMKKLTVQVEGEAKGLGFTQAGDIILLVNAKITYFDCKNHELRPLYENAGRGIVHNNSLHVVRYIKTLALLFEWWDPS